MSISIKYKNYFDSHFYQGDFVTFAKLTIKTIIINIDKISNYELKVKCLNFIFVKFDKDSLSLTLSN